MEVSNLLAESSDSSVGSGDEPHAARYVPARARQRSKPATSVPQMSPPSKRLVLRSSRPSTPDRGQRPAGPSSDAPTDGSLSSMVTSAVSVTHLLSKRSSLISSASAVTAHASASLAHGQPTASPAATPWRPKAPPSTPFPNKAAPQSLASSQPSVTGRESLVLSRELSAGDLAAALEAELEEIERRYISGGGSEPPSRRSSPAGTRRRSKLSSPADSLPGGGAPEAAAPPSAPTLQVDNTQAQQLIDAPSSSQSGQHDVHTLYPLPSLPRTASSASEMRPEDSAQHSARPSSSTGLQADAGVQAHLAPMYEVASRVLLSFPGSLPAPDTEPAQAAAPGQALQGAEVRPVPAVQRMSHIPSLHEVVSASPGVLDTAAAMRILERMQATGSAPSSAVKAVQALLRSPEEASVSPRGSGGDHAVAAQAVPSGREAAAGTSFSTDGRQVSSGDGKSTSMAPVAAHPGPARSLLAMFESHAGADVLRQPPHARTSSPNQAPVKLSFMHAWRGPAAAGQSDASRDAQPVAPGPNIVTEGRSSLRHVQFLSSDTAGLATGGWPGARPSSLSSPSPADASKRPEGWGSGETASVANSSPNNSSGTVGGTSPVDSASTRVSDGMRTDAAHSSGGRSGGQASAGAGSSASDLTLAVLMADGDCPDSCALHPAASVSAWAEGPPAIAQHANSEHDAEGAAARAEAAALALLEAIERRVEAESADASLGRDILDLGLQLNLRLAHLDLSAGAALSPRTTAPAAATADGQQAEREELLRAARLAAFRALQARLLEVQARYDAKRRRRRRASRANSLAGASGMQALNTRKLSCDMPTSPGRRYGSAGLSNGAVPSKTLQSILAQLGMPSPSSAEKRTAGAAELDGREGSAAAGGGGRDGKGPRYNIEPASPTKPPAGGDAVSPAMRPVPLPSWAGPSAPDAKPDGAPVARPAGTLVAPVVGHNISGKEPRMNMNAASEGKARAASNPEPAVSQPPLQSAGPPTAVSGLPLPPLHEGPPAEAADASVANATGGPSGVREPLTSAVRGAVTGAPQRSSSLAVYQPPRQLRPGSVPSPGRPLPPVHVDAAAYVTSVSPARPLRALSAATDAPVGGASVLAPSPARGVAPLARPATAAPARGPQLPSGSQNIRSPQTAALDAARAAHFASSPEPRKLPPRASSRASSPFGKLGAPGLQLSSPDANRRAGVQLRPAPSREGLGPQQLTQQRMLQSQAAVLHKTYSVSPQRGSRAVSASTTPSRAIVAVTAAAAAPVVPQRVLPAASPAAAAPSPTRPVAAVARPRCASAPRATMHAAASGLAAAAAAATSPRSSPASPSRQAMSRGTISNLLQAAASSFELNELRALCLMARSLPDLQPMQRVELWARLERLLAYKLARSPRGDRGGGAEIAGAGGSGGGADTGGGSTGQVVGLTARSHSPLRGYTAVWERRRLSASFGRRQGRPLGRSASFDSGFRAATARSRSPQRALSREFDAAAYAVGGGEGAQSDRPRRPASASAAAPLRLLRSPGGLGAAAAKGDGSSPSGKGSRGEALLDCTLEVVRRLMAPNATLARAMSLNWQALRAEAARQESAADAAGAASAVAAAAAQEGQADA